MKSGNDDEAETFKLAYWANKALGEFPGIVEEAGFDRAFYDLLYSEMMVRLVPFIKKEMRPNFRFDKDDNDYIADFLVVSFVYYKGRDGQGNFRDLGDTAPEEIKERLDYIVQQMVGYFKEKYG